MTTPATYQLALPLGPPQPSGQLTLALDPAPAAPSPPAKKPTHRYSKNRDGKVVCARCGVERREAATGLRGGFRHEWRVFSQEAGDWVWTPTPPPCVPAAPKPTPKRRRGRLAP